jgi:hypothetical protein
MVGVEFVTRRIAPLQDHHREIWRHRSGDDLRLHVSELNADAREEVIRAFFSSAAVPAIPPLGTAPEPSGKRRTTPTEPEPSRAASPPLPEILGRPTRITAEPHVTDPWERVLAAVTGTLRDEVARACSAEEARIDEGWALLHQATERCHLLDRRIAERRERARKEAEEIRASAADEAEEALANARESARGVLARAHEEAMKITSEAPSGLPT